MTGVSCRALEVLFAVASTTHIPLPQLFDGIEVEGRAVCPRELAASKRRIPWETFVRLVNRVSDVVGGPDRLRALGAAHVSSDGLSIIQRVGRAVSHPRDLYYMGARWAGPSLFPMVHAEMSELPDGRLVQTLYLDDESSDCPAFFHLVHGILINAPLAWGHGHSHVHLDLAPRRATFTIQTAQAKRGWIGRFLRSARAGVAFPTMLRELEDQQSTIDKGYRELREAHDRIAAQAADLERVNSIGRQLAEDIDLDHLSDALIRILLEDLGIDGTELRLVRAGPAGKTSRAQFDRALDAERARDLRVIRRAGNTPGAATSTHDLVAAGRAIGTLAIWRTSPLDSRLQQSKDALLERLLPWIAIALDNARSYESIERHAAELEERVKERTTRLLTANHHLVREINERRRATEALVASEAQLRAAERLASIGTLAAGIAHEINNPIGSILAAAQFAQVIRGDTQEDYEVGDALSDIVNEAKRCGEIVRSILQFSRDERTEKWPCRVSDFVNRSVRITSAFADENQAVIRARHEEPSPWARVNPIQLEQAVVNLMRNAIESGAKKIDVLVRNDATKQLASIEISDDGPGISEEDRLRICEPFYTTKQEMGGTGLGLSVVHGIAAEHGGEIRIQANAVGGTTVALALPTCPAPPQPLEDKESHP